MDRSAIAALILSSLLPNATFAQTVPAPPAAPAAAAPAPAANYSVRDTDIATLWADPAAKTILIKYLPQLDTAEGTPEQVQAARALSLKALQQYARDEISDKILENIQADLNKLPVKK